MTQANGHAGRQGTPGGQESAARVARNRLALERSPYLLQHAGNPVDWYPWGEEALRRARDEDKPIFLSVGYSTCHWCHVMERDCFERDDVAAVLNESFIAVKVDREERPDLDHTYMMATQLATGNGGWPNSVWLTPDGRPFFAGTYFPREVFIQLLTRIRDVWAGNRQAIEEQATALADAVRGLATQRQPSGEVTLSKRLIEGALGNLRRHFDSVNGGFDTAPKFPPHGSLALLVHESQQAGQELHPMAARTLDAMAAGGIHDHLGGGFHRYSTDAQWRVPHFEKMLYDNAQLAPIYATAWRMTGRPFYREAALGICNWVLREMTDDATGGFYSALDADSEGVEGRSYVWTEAEVLSALGPQAGALFCAAYGVTPKGSFRDESAEGALPACVLRVAKSTDELASAFSLAPEDVAARLQAARAVLLGVRAQRARPHLDDKIIVAWNGLMIGALAHAAAALEQPIFLAAAIRAAEFILADLWDGSTLLHSYRQGPAAVHGFLDDYACLASGLLDLHEATRDPRWVTAATALVDAAERHFADSANGGFFYVEEAGATPLLRDRDAYESATPGGNGAMALCLARLAAVTGSHVRRAAAQRLLEAFAGLMEETPRAAGSFLLATALWLEETPGARSGEPAPPVGMRFVARAAKFPVEAEFFLPAEVAEPRETTPFQLHLAVAPGWRLTAMAADGTQAGPVRLRSEPDSVLDAKSIEWQAAANARGETPSGDLWITGRLRTPQTAERAVRQAGATAATAKPSLLVSYQACGEGRCLPQATLRLELPRKSRDEG